MSEPAPEAPPETMGERVSGFFHRDAPAVQAVSADVQALLRGHSAALVHAVADILEKDWPDAGPVASQVLEVALAVARVAGIAL